MTAPVFAQVNLVVSDMYATLAFYRSLGLTFADHAGAVWPPGTGARHAEAVPDGGPVLEFDNVEMAGLWHRAHRGSDVRGAPGRVVLGFALASRSDVDERYATLTGAGHRGVREPHDAFWGGRYAVVADPDGNECGLMSPADGARVRPHRLITLLRMEPTPSLLEWAGGEPAVRRLLDAFYDQVERDDLLAPVFPGGVSETHRANVTLWWVEVFGGPPGYTETHGGYATMLAHHRNLGITAEQRFRFASLMSRAADTAGLPDDPEFRAAFVGYVEWGTRLALHNSQPDAPVVEQAPVPRWGWGVAPPYRP